MVMFCVIVRVGQRDFTQTMNSSHEVNDCGMVSPLSYESLDDFVNSDVVI